MGLIKNIMGGVATVLCVSPRPMRRKFGDKNAPRSVAEALRRDWLTVGRGIERAMGTVKAQRRESRARTAPNTNAAC